MNVIIHDLPQEDFYKSCGENDTVLWDNGSLKPCTGCFGCWIKTPGQCVIKDGFHDLGRIFSKCERLILISACRFGSYSPFIHNIMDRSIPYALPYFEMRSGEIHHKPRYENRIRLSVYFYGKDITERQKNIAAKLVKANGINLHAQTCEVQFFDHADAAVEGIE